MEPMSEVATTVYSPRCSAAMLRMLQACTWDEIHRSCDTGLHGQQHACCRKANNAGTRTSPAATQAHFVAGVSPAHSSTTLPNVAFSRPPIVSPNRTARSSVTSPRNSARGMSARKFCGVGIEGRYSIRWAQQTGARACKARPSCHFPQPPQHVKLAAGPRSAPHCQPGG